MIEKKRERMCVDTCNGKIHLWYLSHARNRAPKKKKKWNTKRHAYTDIYTIHVNARTHKNIHVHVCKYTNCKKKKKKLHTLFYGTAYV